MTLRRVPVQGACPGVEQVSQYSKHTGCGLIGAGPAKATSCRGQPAMQPGSRPASQRQMMDRQPWRRRASVQERLAGVRSFGVCRRRTGCDAVDAGPPSPFSLLVSLGAPSPATTVLLRIPPGTSASPPRRSSCVPSAADRSALPSLCFIFLCVARAHPLWRPRDTQHRVYPSPRVLHILPALASASSPPPWPIPHPHLDRVRAGLLDTPARLCRAPLRRLPPARARRHRFPLTTAAATAATTRADTDQHNPKARIVPTRPCV